MKKYALVMALALAASLAQADATVYGKARLYQENTKTGTAEGVTALTNDSSRFGIKATEALANGITAGVVLETGYGGDAPAATTLGDRTAVVGLSHEVVPVDEPTLGEKAESEVALPAVEVWLVEVALAEVGPAVHTADYEQALPVFENAAEAC